MQTEKKSKKLFINMPVPFEFHSVKLGLLSVAILTVDALSKLSPELDSELGLDDEDVIRALVVLLSVKKDENNTKITEQEVKEMSVSELDSFSLAVLKSQHWIPTDSIYIETPQRLLVQKIKDTITSLGKSTKDILKSFESIFSSPTKQLFMQNVAWNEKLKEMAGLTSVGAAYANMMKDQNDLIERLSNQSTVSAAYNALNSPSALAIAATISNENGLSSILKNPALLTANDILSSQDYKNISESLANTHALNDSFSSSSLSKLKKANSEKTIENNLFSSSIMRQPNQIHSNKLLDATNETNNKLNNIAGAIGVMSELIVKSQLELEKKHQDDLERHRLHAVQLEQQHHENAISQRKSMKVAVIALVISAILSVISVFLSYFSLDYDKKSYELSLDKEQPLVSHEKVNQLPKQLPKRADKKIEQEK